MASNANGPPAKRARISAEAEGALTNAIKTFGSDAFGKALGNIQTVFGKESSSCITQHGSGRGFQQLSINASQKDYIVQQAKLEPLLKLFMDAELASCPPSCKTAVANVFKELALASEGKSNEFQVHFSDGRGSLWTLYLSVERLSDGRYRMRKASINGKFKLMADFVVVTHSRKNFLSSKVWDEIVYIPRGLTSGDLQAILQCLPSPSMLCLASTARSDGAA